MPTRSQLSPRRQASHGRPRRWWRTAVPVAAVSVLVAPMALAAAPPAWEHWANYPGPSGGKADTAADGSDPNANQLSLGQQWWAYSARPGEMGAVPQAMAWDQVLPDGRRTKKTMAAVTRNEDASAAKIMNTKLLSEDNGDRFVDNPSFPADFAMNAGAQLRDGALVTVDFVPKPVSGAPRGGLRTAWSTDNGKSWSFVTGAIVENKWKFDWYRTTRGTIELSDGTILQGMYGGATRNGVKGSYTLILQSSDRGKSWTQRGLLNTDGDSTELALSRTSDGRLIGISRGAEPGGTPTRPMWQFYSADDGVTWTKQPYVPPAGYPKFGIMPELVLQPNGALLLTYGRPDNYIAVSWDGAGRTWDDGKLVYSNYIRDTRTGRWMGSSGNTSLMATEANYSLNYGDICHNIWSCMEYGQQTGIWVRRIDAVTAGAGKLDLATGIRDGVMKVTGTEAPADQRFPQQRLAGAVDGSTGYRAAARFADTAAATRGLVIELDKAYPINKIGLMLDQGTANSAKVQLSTDGKNWGRPVVQQRNSTDYALRHHPLAQPVTAKYVRITKDAGAPLTAVNELELYAADTYTFENDPVYAVPRGLKDTLHALTADTFRYMSSAHSQRRLNLIDTDPDTRARATFPMSARARTTVAFDYSGQGYGAGPVWELTGKDAAGNAVTGWKFNLQPDFANKAFTLNVFDGTTWQKAGTIGSWVENYHFFPIAISADATSATVTVTGDSLTTTVKAGTIASFDGFRASTGRADTDINMEHSYDNVSLG